MDRRDLLKTGTAAAAFAASGTALVSLGKTVTIETQAGALPYPVTDGFYQRMLSRHQDLASMSFRRLEGEQQMLLQISDARARRLVPDPVEPIYDGHLTDAESDRLAVVTHVINCHNAARYLRGRPLSDFGFAGIDEVHGNCQSHTAIGECGCVLGVVFNHAHIQAKAWGADLAKTIAVREKLLGCDGVPRRAHDAMAALELKYRSGFLHFADIAGLTNVDLADLAKSEAPTIPHYADKVCKDHAHLASDPVALHAAVFRDNEGVAAVIQWAYEEVAKGTEAMEAPGARALVG